MPLYDVRIFKFAAQYSPSRKQSAYGAMWPCFSQLFCYNADMPCPSQHPQLTKPGAPAAAPAAAAAATAAAPPAAAISAAQQRAIEAAARLGLQATIATAAPSAATAAPVPVAPGAGAAPRPTGPVSGQRAGFKPAPLLLDAQGREVDEKGQVIAKPVQAVTTLKVSANVMHQAFSVAMCC